MLCCYSLSLDVKARVVKRERERARKREREQHKSLAIDLNVRAQSCELPSKKGKPASIRQIPNCSRWPVGTLVRLRQLLPDLWRGHEGQEPNLQQPAAFSQRPPLPRAPCRGRILRSRLLSNSWYCPMLSILHKFFLRVRFLNEPFRDSPTLTH